MPTPRALDPDKLRELLDPAYGGNPDMDRAELAGRLTAHNRTLGSDVVVTTKLVTAAISRLREQWKADGFDLAVYHRERRGLVRMLVENSGHQIAEQYHWYSQLVRNLRYIDRMRAGLQVPQNRVSAAQSFEAGLRLERKVVDVTPAGKPILRPALPCELDEHGHLIEIVCASQAQRQGSGTEDARPV